jgi:hypothetical protein
MHWLTGFGRIKCGKPKDKVRSVGFDKRDRVTCKSCKREVIRWTGIYTRMNGSKGPTCEFQEFDVNV